MKKSKDLLKTGLLVLVVSLILLSTELSLILQDNGDVSSNQGGVSVDEESGVGVWDEYVSEQYGIRFSYPRLLLKKEYKNQGGYDLFVRFEENDLSRDKGVAFGVSKISLREEVQRLKKSMSGDEQVIVKTEKEVGVGGSDGILLEFEPKTPENGEKRSVLIFEKGEFAYSLSTVPEQMQRIIESIELTP